MMDCIMCPFFVQVNFMFETYKTVAETWDEDSSVLSFDVVDIDYWWRKYYNKYTITDNTSQ